MESKQASESAGLLQLQPAPGPAVRKFGTDDLWAFDVPAWAEFFNSPESVSPAVRGPDNAIADHHWVAALGAGYNTGN